MDEIDAPYLEKVAIFAGLPAEALLYLDKRLEKAEFAKGQTILEYGKRGDFLAIVASGQVELKDTRGKAHKLEPGQTFGEGMLRYGVASSFTATARKDTTLWLLSRIDWLVAKEISLTSAREEALTAAKQAASEKKTEPEKPAGLRAWGWAWVTLLVLGLLALGPPLLDQGDRSLVKFALWAGRPDLAESLLVASASWLPKSSQLYESLGTLSYLQGNVEGAAAAFEKAVTLDETYAAAQNNLGIALLGMSEAQAAIEHLEQAVSLDPGNAAVYYNLGNAYWSIKDGEKAAEAYQRAIELDPEQNGARAMLAGIALQDGQSEQARAAWNQVLEADPNQAMARQGLGVIAMQEGYAEQALPDLEAAKEADPADATTRLYLGLALEALGRPGDAAEEFVAAISLSNDPSLTSLAKSHLEKLQP